MQTSEAMHICGMTERRGTWATPRWHRTEEMMTQILRQCGSYRSAAIDAGLYNKGPASAGTIERVYGHVTGAHVPVSNEPWYVLCPVTALWLVAGAGEAARLIGCRVTELSFARSGARDPLQRRAVEPLRECVDELFGESARHASADLEVIARLRLISDCARATGLTREAVRHVLECRTEPDDWRNHEVEAWARTAVEARIAVALAELETWGM